MALGEGVRVFDVCPAMRWAKRWRGHEAHLYETMLVETAHHTSPASKAAQLSKRVSCLIVPPMIPIRNHKRNANYHEVLPKVAVLCIRRPCLHSTRGAHTQMRRLTNGVGHV
jgi:hypothetical protein